MKKYVTIMILATISACASKAPTDSTHGDTPGDTTPGTNPGDTTPGPDGSTNPPGDTTPVGDGGSAPKNQAECLTACEVQYPAAAKKNKALDATCMLGGSCEPVCNDLVSTGKNYPPTPGVDGGTTCDTKTANSYPISTPSEACSNCLATTPSCCSQWISLFGSLDGQALNKCSVTCFTNFKN